MERTDIAAHRVLLVGGKTHGVQLLRTILGIAGITNITHAEDVRYALDLLGMEHFSALFCHHGVEAVGGRPFIIAARRAESVLNPMIPIFVLKERARRRDVEKARDIGATDLLTTPISPRTILAKLEAATHAPRSFVIARDFFGPDRRARRRATYFGSDRRNRKARQAKTDLTFI